MKPHKHMGKVVRARSFASYLKGAVFGALVIVALNSMNHVIYIHVLPTAIMQTCKGMGFNENCRVEK